MAAAAAAGIDAPISALPGGGPVTVARLGEAGITTARDLLLRLPLGYEDLRRPVPLAALDTVGDGEAALVRGTVRQIHLFPRRFLTVTIEEGAAIARARWFRPPAAMAKGFSKGSVVALAGPVRTGKDGVREMIHPRNVTARLAEAGGDGLGLRPRYPAVEGVSMQILERLRAGALERLGAGAPELLPDASRARLALPGLAEALARVHAPQEGDRFQSELTGARRRITFESAIVAQLAFLLRRRALGEAALSVPAAVAERARAGFVAAFGRALTPSQERAIGQIAADLGGGRPMQRLLIGDVGSGKTAVATAAAAMVAAAGGQTLMMAPTETLAEQQARVLGPLAARMGLSIAVLTGSTPAGRRQEILAAAAAGDLALLIGTQALLGPSVGMPRLGLVIVDEQHRFGVEERSRLGRPRAGAAGWAGTPHLLAMSATPIPRSLALALHGDLDASFLTERPSGRPPPAAVLCRTPAERIAAYGRVREAVDAGAQAFVICPVREQAVRDGAVTAIALHARLRRELAPARVGLLHGALDGKTKEASLRAFAAGDVDVLVATTVVELGIDVPNAAVMVIEDADRFGLAALHQLRGRVGRGERPGICFVCPSRDGISAAAVERLRRLSEIDDGFRLAEADLAERGAGDLFGVRQAGFAEAGDPAEWLGIATLARQEAEAILAADPQLAATAHQPLARAALDRVATLFGPEAG